MCIVGLVQTGPITYNLQTIDSTGIIHDYRVERVVATPRGAVQTAKPGGTFEL